MSENIDHAAERCSDRWGHRDTSDPVLTELLNDAEVVAKAYLALRRRVAELEATAARRLELLWPFATAYDVWVAADTDAAIEITPDQARAAAAEVAAGET
jgi:hypothetical protein